MVLDASLFNIQHYKVWIKGALGNKGVLHIPQCFIIKYNDSISRQYPEATLLDY